MNAGIATGVERPPYRAARWLGRTFRGSAGQSTVELALVLPVLVLVIRKPGETQPLDHGPMRDEPERLHALEIGRIQEQLAKLR